MSCSKRVDRVEHYICNGCCASNSGNEKRSCASLEPEIRLCFCHNGSDCQGRSACPPSKCNSFDDIEYCQCAEEMMWNNCTPPKPDCKWLNNFCELRRQWSNHARQKNCRCCNCKPRSSNNEINFLMPMALFSSLSMIPSLMKLVNIKNNHEEKSISIRTCSNAWERKCRCHNIFSYIGNIGYSSLIPGPTALISFIILIFTALGLSSGLSVYQYHSFSKVCLRYSY